MFYTSKVVIVRPCQPGPFLFPCFRDGKIPTFIVCTPGGSGALCIGFYSICKEFMFHEFALSFKLDSVNQIPSEILSEPFSLWSLSETPELAWISVRIYEPGPNTRLIKQSSQSPLVWDLKRRVLHIFVHTKQVVIVHWMYALLSLNDLSTHGRSLLSSMLWSELYPS